MGNSDISRWKAWSRNALLLLSVNLGSIFCSIAKLLLHFQFRILLGLSDNVISVSVFLSVYWKKVLSQMKTFCSDITRNWVNTANQNQKTLFTDNKYLSPPSKFYEGASVSWGKEVKKLSSNGSNRDIWFYFLLDMLNWRKQELFITTQYPLYCFFPFVLFSEPSILSLFHALPCF